MKVPHDIAHLPRGYRSRPRARGRASAGRWLRHPGHRRATDRDGRGDRPPRRGRGDLSQPRRAACSSTAGTSTCRAGSRSSAAQFQLALVGPRAIGSSASRPRPSGYYAPIRPSRAMGRDPDARGHRRDPARQARDGRVGLRRQRAGRRVRSRRRHPLSPDRRLRRRAAGGGRRVVPDQRRRSRSAASAGVLNVRIHGRRDVFPIVNGTDISKLTGTAPELVLDGSGWAPSWMTRRVRPPASRG